jgi:coenzyme PQQ precursor peptide PqqA
MYYQLLTKIRKGGYLMWKSPVVREVAVGLEINCYACAEI